jgi:uncharacterized protein YndB with AHSA1/START domain
MVVKILLGLAIVLVVLAIVVATRPPTFHIERSIVIATPPDRVFANVNDFRAWTAWSPWEKMDPAMTKTYGGSPSGPGATYAWKGNDKVGEGRMTIADVTKRSKIVVNLEFLKPFPSTSVVTFTFAPGAEDTRVTWAMDGDKNFMAKAFHMVVDMDKMLGGDLDRGLADLKRVSESSMGAAKTP